MRRVFKSVISGYRTTFQNRESPNQEAFKFSIVPTVGEFSKVFVDQGKAERQKPSYVSEKQKILKTYIIPVLGDVPLNEIFHADVMTFKTSLLGLKGKSANNILSVLRQLLECGRQHNHLENVLKIDSVREVSPTVDTYSVEDYERLAHTAGRMRPEALAVFLLGGDEGLRRGEMVGLKWSDVDFGTGFITVSRAVWQHIVDTPKNNKTRRIPMTNALIECLRRFERHSEWVFANRYGKRVWPNTLYKWMGHLLDAAGIKHARRLHALRHYFCNSLSEAGAPINTVRELAGHSTVAMTQKYLHPSEIAKVEAISLLNKKRKAKAHSFGRNGPSTTSRINSGGDNPTSADYVSGRQDSNLYPYDTYRTLDDSPQSGFSDFLSKELIRQPRDQNEENKKETNSSVIKKTRKPRGKT